ncbi:hypothetical protein PS925_04437 [Pseudomonas fluorescens]|uniref:Uncharacterized protein n=1 Tax=Pseudomonas fluorescens TaxID=294 RepID=A0A5E7V413_PSEFL|nr:hypothetical protein PS925_04437 [Pseudomonas fluorescens]
MEATDEVYQILSDAKVLSPIWFCFGCKKVQAS